MPETIGKYKVLERIGRGGMGMIFKAHDPVLDRVVALKVISTDIEVTDELRARFFREAQACGRLNHPNIVTIFDMGEDDGRLFIVMEFLEGEELRHLIARRKDFAIEDKLSVMMQVCDGLNYAHQKGIVHRDIKPSNIFLLANGQVKILDFGIAQVANTEAGLTRTGLIIGTLRYISPEQVRGRTDHRSDIFSVGAVFYELLSSRPAFIGDDPLNLLEQLRSEEPPLLHVLDPTIPPALGALVERALRKAPEERFADLQELRVQLEEVQRGFTEETQRARARIRAQRDQLGSLQSELAARIGSSDIVGSAAARIDDSGRLATLQKLENELAERIHALQASIEQADSLAPSLARAADLLAAGEFADAVAEFEAILEDMPAHAQALTGLERARAGVEEDRRRKLAAKLLQDARAALADGGYTLCLEILKQASAIAPPPETASEISTLRDTANSAQAARDAARRARRLAEQAHDLVAPARDAAQTRDAAHLAPTPWSHAEAVFADAQQALATDAYEEAERGFQAAVVSYRRAEDEAREAQRRTREEAQAAREGAAAARDHAARAGAAEHASGLWDSAEATFAEGQKALGVPAFEVARSRFADAQASYERAVAAAQDSKRRQRRRAEEAREETIVARRMAEQHAAPGYAPALWGEAQSRSAAADEAFARERYRDAASSFEAAILGFRRSQRAASEERLREREALAGRDQASQSRERARIADAPHRAGEQWGVAEAKLAEAERALDTGAFVTAAFSEASTLYEKAAEAAAAWQLEWERASASRERAAQSRARAAAAKATRNASELWMAAEAKLADAQSAIDGETPASAVALFQESINLFDQAEQAALANVQRDRQRAEATRDRAVEDRVRADAVRAELFAPDPWREASERAAAGTDALAREEYKGALEAFNEAVALFRRAVKEAEERQRREREDAERSREELTQWRQRALAANAISLGASDWIEAEATGAVGEAALAREAYREATQAFDQGVALYRRAEERAREVARALEAARAEAEKARGATAAARGAAIEARASTYASEPLEAGESAAAQANDAMNRGDYQAARLLFADARRRYTAAALAARVAMEAETRRADAMISDARHLLSLGEVEACLRRIDDVLALRPGDRDAMELRHAAEDRQRGRGAGVDELPYDGESTQAVDVGNREAATPETIGETGETIIVPAALITERTDRPPETLPTPPSAVDVTALPSAFPQAPPNATETSATRSTMEKVAASRETADTVPLAFPDAPRIPRRAGTAPSSPHARLRRRTSPALAFSATIIVLGLLAAITWYWLHRPGDAPRLDELRNAVAAARMEAERAGAKPLKQFQLANGQEQAGDTALARHQMSAAEQQYKDAIASYHLAAQAGRASTGARASQRAAIAARESAERAGAQTRAVAVWAKAEDAVRAAEAALEQQAFERAQALFTTAERGYNDAQAASVAALGTQQRGEAEQARNLAARARQEAEIADARRLAATSFGAAQQKEDECSAKFNGGDFSAAAALANDAARLYTQASKEAAFQRVEARKSEAVRARDRATSAQRQADQSGAAQKVPLIYAWAQEKEQAGVKALSGSDFLTAEQLFDEARTDYETATQEAKRSSAGGSTLQANAEQARNRALSYRDLAVKADAERLATDVFVIAQAKEVGAEELMNRRSYAPATQAYREIGDFQLTAMRRARDRRDADAVRSRMRSEKQRASSGSPEYKTALTLENQGTAAYDRFAYRDAADKFQTAQSLYAHATDKPGAAASAPPTH
jgi:serine/threonine protein kinase